MWNRQKEDRLENFVARGRYRDRAEQSLSDRGYRASLSLATAEEITACLAGRDRSPGHDLGLLATNCASVRCWKEAVHHAAGGLHHGRRKAALGRLWEPMVHRTVVRRRVHERHRQGTWGLGEYLEAESRLGPHWIGKLSR